ncbi:MAG TPA: hypothetical protein VH573_00610, partial [Mycobacteriales bacterium]
ARGYLSITPLSTRDWRLVAQRGPDGSLRPEELTVLQAVFAAGPDTTLAPPARSRRPRAAAAGSPADRPVAAAVAEAAAAGERVITPERG